MSDADNNRTIDERLGDLAELFRLAQELKRLKRTGWLDRGVPRGKVESVADHGYLTALIAWLTASLDPALDSDRVLKLALIHDLQEAIVGDLPPYEPEDVPGPDDLDALRAFFSVRHLRTPGNAVAKQQAEREAIDRLLGLMPDALRPAMAPLWEEYEVQETAEARFVKQVDRLEAFLQSKEYDQEHPQLSLWGFTDMADKEVDHPLLVAIREAARDDRGND